MQVGEVQRIFPDGVMDGSENGVSPVATWYDSGQHHFVALLGRRHDTAPPTLSELVEYQIISTATKTDTTQAHLLKFRLPPTLAIETHHVTADLEQLLLTRRIPVDAKLSLDRRLLVIQFSSTLVRVIPVEEPDDNHMSVSSTHKHWTIDLSSGNAEPASTAPYAIPINRNESPSTWSNTGNFLTKTGNNETTKILPNGIIWSDHGGNSQDLVVVTNKAVFCYKVSLQRSQMAVTYSFSQSPPACAVWWDPLTRSVVLGSMGPAKDCANVVKNKSGSVVITLQLRTFLLRYPTIGKKSKRLPRLELPPPKRLPPYAVGRSRLSRISSGSQTPIIRNEPIEPIITPNEMWLGNIYGDTYAIELEHQFTIGLQLVLHRVDPTLGVIYYKTYTIENFHPETDDMDTLLLAILDNVLFLIFRRQRKSLFLDIADEDNVFFLEDTDERVWTLDSPHISFLSPNLLLDPTGKGHLIPIALDIEKLANNIPWTPSVVPFFLRRNAPQLRAHEIAMSKLADLLESPHPPSDMKRTMDLLVQMYAVDPGALGWDWKATLPLLYSCALLPAAAALRFHNVDRMIMRHGSKKLAGKESRRSILYQREVLEKIILPAVKMALKKRNQDAVRSLHQILDFGLGFLGALDRNDCPPCPALEGFLFFILWHLGYEPELTQFLLSRCQISHSYRAKLRDASDSVAINTGIVLLVDMMNAVAETVDFGAVRYLNSSKRSGNRRCVRVHRLVKSLSTRLLRARVTDELVATGHLLADGRLLEAIQICLKSSFKLDSARDNDMSFTAKWPSSDESAIALRFFRTALSSCKNESDLGNRFRLLSCLHSFFYQRDPNLFRGLLHIALSGDSGIQRRSIDDLDGTTGRSHKSYHRRPSFRASDFHQRGFRQKIGGPSMNDLNRFLQNTGPGSEGKVWEMLAFVDSSNVYK